MWTVQWVKDAGERCAKSVAQALILLLLGDGAFDVFEVPDWKAVAGIALGAAVLSLLTSVLSLPISNRGTASLVSEVKYQPKTPLGGP